MDPSVLSKYEIIYETLSASDSDSETYTHAGKGSIVDGVKNDSEKRKVIKNFIIIQPSGKKKDGGNISQFQTAMSGVSKQDPVPYQPSNTSNLASVIVVNKNYVNNVDASVRISKESTEKFKTVFTEVNRNSNQHSLEKEPKLEEFQEQDEGKIGHTNVGSDGLSMGTIQNVIERTISRVLQDELPTLCNDRMATLVDTSKKKCPYCQFSTMSKFSLKKHIALHENNLGVVFSEGISGKSSDQLFDDMVTERHQCPKCFDLFRTEIGLKYHFCSSVSEGITLEKENLQEENGKEQGPTVTVTAECSEPAVVTALRFLNQKPIDLENLKEEVNSFDNQKKSAGNPQQTLLYGVGTSTESSNILTPDETDICKDKYLQQENRRSVIIKTQDVRDYVTLLNSKGSNNNVESQDAKYLREILEESAEIKKELTTPPGSIKCVDEQVKIEPYEIVLETFKDEGGDSTFDKIKKELIVTSMCDDDSYDDLEREMAILTGEEDVADTHTLMDYSMAGNPCDIPIEIKYNALEDNNNKECLPNIVKLDVIQSNNTVEVGSRNYFGNRLKDLQASWRENRNYVYDEPRKEISAEKAQFNNLIEARFQSYKAIFPFMSQRRHVPGGIQCPDCQSFYKSFFLLRRHWDRIHDTATPLLTCSFCDYKTNQKGLLDSHVKHRHDNSEKEFFPCDQCSKIYLKACRLNKHKLLHHTDKSYLVLSKCDMCSFSSYDPSNLKKHIERKHLACKYLCMYCGHMAKSKYSMDKHEMDHEGKTVFYNCKVCLDSFDHKLDLLSHQQILHYTEPIYFYCQNCEFKTLNKELLVVHGNATHRNVKHFQCSDCPLVLKDLVTLAQHITRKHNPYIPWKYCAHCSYKSLRKSAIASHVTKHLPRKIAPIKCKLCKYRTYKRHYYVRHYNVRHNPNAIYYQCYHCDYSNKVKAKLHQHMQEKGHLLT